MGTRNLSGIAIALLLAALFVYDAAAAALAWPTMETRDYLLGQPLWLLQVSPSERELARYDGLHAAAAKGDIGEIGRLIAAGVSIESRDSHGRTPLMVAAFRRNHAAAKALVDAGADLGAVDHDRYDMLTIAAVLNDLDMVDLAIAAGASTGLITSPYDGTALIAAAHLGHVEVVQALIDGKAPLDHVNNLGWTALIEAIVLGDGGPDHTAIVQALVDAGADPNLPDGNGQSPLALAQQRGFAPIAAILQRAGGRP